MDGNKYRRQSPGQACSLTLGQVLEIREVYSKYCHARAEKHRLQKSLDLTPDELRRYGTGLRGKKFRD